MPVPASRATSVKRGMMATKAQSAEVSATADSGGDGFRRRDFLNIAPVAFVGVGAVAAVAEAIRLVLGL